MNNIVYKDEYTWEDASKLPYQLLETVFKEGKIVEEQTLSEVRSVLHGGKF
jgi:hypothetical protein